MEAMHKKLLIPLMLLFVIGCKDKPPPKTTTDEQPLDSLDIQDVVPTSGAGVYMDAGNRLWYVEGTTGMVVRTTNGRTINPCSIVPTSGRGVYVQECPEDHYWYVEYARAFSIREVRDSGAMDTIAPQLSTVVGAYMEKYRQRKEQEAVEEWQRMEAEAAQ